MLRSALLKRVVASSRLVPAQVALPISAPARFTSDVAGDAPAAEAAVDTSFPLSLTERNRQKRVQMPSSRGEAWGQVLVSNRDLVVAAAPWTPKSRRAGVIARKIGMLAVWDSHGRNVPCTVVQIEDCQVTAVNPHISERRGTLSLEVGGINRKEKNVNKPLLGHFHRARVHPKLHVKSVEVTPDAVLPVGWKFDARHFVPGQYLDVTGTTTGKGFQGVMKRHGYGGLSASHGVSVSHRSLGSTGQRQDPGRVFKNKAMPGHMGAAPRTIQNVRVFKIDPKRNMLYLMGNVPGQDEGCLVLRDAIKRPFSAEAPPPFPTFIAPEKDAKEPLVIPDSLLGPDPFAGGAI